MNAKKRMLSSNKIDVYIEFINDWLTVEKMADYYSLKPQELDLIINEGRKEYNEKFWSKKTK